MDRVVLVEHSSDYLTPVRDPDQDHTTVRVRERNDRLLERLGSAARLEFEAI